MIESDLKRQGTLKFAHLSGLRGEEHFHFIRLASVLIAVIMFTAYCAARIGMREIPSFLPLILSVTLILLPEALKPLCRLNGAFRQTIVLVSFFLLGWVSILLNVNLVVIVYAAFAVALYSQFRFKVVSFQKRKALKLALIILFGLELTATAWTPDYMNPLAPEAYAVGLRFVHVDTLFLSTLTAHIRNFHVPTLGLFGLEPLTYHAGSNYLFASYAQLCRADILEFYNFGFPVIFIPQFFQGFFFAVFSNVRRAWNDRRMIVSLVIFFFVLTGLVSQRVGSDYMLSSSINSHLISQSYCVSLILTFLFISAYSPLIKERLLDRNPVVNALLFLLIPCWFFMIGYMKVSTGLVLFATLGYFLLRRRLIFKRWVFLAMALTALVLYRVLQLTVESNENTFIIQPGSFLNMFVKGNVVLYFILNYWWLLLLIIATVLVAGRDKARLYPDLVAGKFVVAETVVVAAIVGALPGLLIHIPGGSAVYFSDVQYWLASIAFIYIASYAIFRHTKLRDKLMRYSRILVLIAAVIIVREAVFRSFYYFLKKNIRIRAALVYGKDNERLQQAKLIELAPIIHSLLFNIQDAEQYKSQTSMLNLPVFEELRSMPDSVQSQSIIYCQDPEMLESFLPCSEATFYIPAMSEMPTINGLRWLDCWMAGGYGMRVYFPFPKQITQEEAFRLAREKGFRNLIILNLQQHKFTIERL